MPVAEETFGGTPIASRRGLKMTPPPSPSAPATHPPPKPRHRTFLRTLPLNIKSLSARLIPPYFSLRAYSAATFLQEIKTIATIQLKNTATATQSGALHLANVFPRRIQLTRRMQRATKLIPCFFHCPWPRSYLTIFFTCSISLWRSGSFSGSTIGSPNSASTWPPVVVVAYDYAVEPMRVFGTTSSLLPTIGLAFPFSSVISLSPGYTFDGSSALSFNSVSYFVFSIAAFSFL